LKSIKLPSIRPPSVMSSPYLLYFGKHGSEISKDLVEAGKRADPAEIAAECKRRWESLSENDRNGWQGLYDELMTNPAYEESQLYVQAREALEAFAKQTALSYNMENLRAEIDKLKLAATTAANASELWRQNPDASPAVRGFVSVLGEKDYIGSELPGPHTASDDDFRMDSDSQKGLAILEQGKSDLLKRLEPDSEQSGKARASRNTSTTSSVPPSLSGQNGTASPGVASDVVEPVSEDEESDEDDYPVAGDDGRGLLTDVPLILGPQEIEVLPMIIQSGVVPPVPGSPGSGKHEQEAVKIRHMHALRCHLLLAQNNGQNLLRELLIFVAAWDLRDEDLYFKIMANIMDAILMNGLMPFAYHTFREAKDIISPAQAVIMKMLTNIFRSRQAKQPRLPPGAKPPPPSDSLTYPSSYEARMVKYLFSEFRNHIIPQTCALIFLQGKIRDGTASPEDFPLNLWDMERMYEGIYQYLEFFAILTEHDKWKWMMSQWEITSELVTLLEELDTAIPRSTPQLRPPEQQRRPAQPPPPPQPAAPPAPAPAVQQPIAVERPYDVNSPDQAPNSAQPPPVDAAPDSGYLPPAEDEPSDFEWRNLKKLAVLVLSSLVWKSPLVQSQLGKADRFGRPGRGIRALLNCCQVDDYNPYIKEHAIMALRFALESNEDNQSIVRNLTRVRATGGKETASSATSAAEPTDSEPEGRPPLAKMLGNVDVPKEVLDLNGWETYVDAKGQVQLKRREGGRRVQPATAGVGNGRMPDK
jgi:palmitoyltransferase